MTPMQRRSAALCLAAAAMLRASGAAAGVWGVDPVLGLTADYGTNPVLLDVPHTAQTDAALLIDAPATWNADAFKFSVLPSFRVGDTRSYASLNSDYEHLTARGEYDTERSTLTASAGVTRDSSLYLNYLVNGAEGVRRDGASADFAWTRQLTERLQFETDLDASRVRYGSAAGTSSLVDYKYASVTPTLLWTATERTKISLAASAGQYDSLDGATRSRNANLQLGFVRPLAENWSLSASGGFSRAVNRIDFAEQFAVLTGNGLQLVRIPVREEFAQNGAVYSVSLTRQRELLTLTLTASRQETPTGFAFLSRQTTIEFQPAYTLSARWSLSADAKYLSAQDPQRQGPAFDRTVKYYGLNAVWQWTEQTTLTFGASRIGERSQLLRLDLASDQIAVTLSRKFNHIGFQ